MNARGVSSPTAFDRLASLKPRAVSMTALPPARMEAGQFPLERRNLVTRERLERRVRAEFLEMPGLTLTVAQASRLWSFEASFCMAVLGALEEARFLVRTRHSAFARAD